MYNRVYIDFYESFFDVSWLQIGIATSDNTAGFFNVPTLAFPTFLP